MMLLTVKKNKKKTNVRAVKDNCNILLKNVYFYYCYNCCCYFKNF